jgi:hypothetical protein
MRYTKLLSCLVNRCLSQRFDHGIMFLFPLKISGEKRHPRSGVCPFPLIRFHEIANVANMMNSQMTLMNHVAYKHQGKHGKSCPELGKVWDVTFQSQRFSAWLCSNGMALLRSMTRMLSWNKCSFAIFTCTKRFRGPAS